MLLDQVSDVLFIGTFNLPNLFAVLESDEGGHCLDPALLRDFFGSIHIDLSEDDGATIGILARHSLEDRPNLSTRRAPSRSEVNYHELLTLDQIIELIQCFNIRAFTISGSRYHIHFRAYRGPL